ncbi:hypothetical protein QUF54_04905, partial [Candidatus Marithioploca araucensis]|nr:hypothetical protein [Candidatus Marithioploca araucensis]
SQILKILIQTFEGDITLVFKRFLEFNSLQTREVNTMKQVAPLRYDVIFKKAFSHPALFTAISKDFLGIQLEIDKVEHEAFSVATKLFAEDKKNRVIVEVQHAHYSDSYERFLYYQCSAMVETIVSSSNYRFPMTVMTIVFFTGKKTPKSDSGIVVFEVLVFLQKTKTSKGF